MWTEPSSALVAGLQSIVLAAGLLGVGFLVADVATSRLRPPIELRWALALPGLLLFALVLMGAHVISGGRVFSSPAIVRTVTAVCAVGLLVARWVAPKPTIDRRAMPAVLACVLVAVAVWGIPVFTSLPLNFEPDTDLHMGWASQLMNGAPTPTSPVTGRSPNYYPWMYHALVALAAPFTPSGRAFSTLGTLQLVQIAGAAASLFALGRALTGKIFTGFAAVAFGALLGGLGIFVLGGIDELWEALRSEGSIPTALGDVFARRTYSFAFNGLAPALPRDVTFALIPAAAALLTMTVTRRAVAPLAGAGVVVGLIGLTGGEALLVALVVGVVVAAFRPPAGRVTALGWFLGPMLVTYGLWAGPLIVHYIELGGFVNTTRVNPVVQGPLEILASWSIATPFALLGAAIWFPVRRAPREALIPFAFTAIPALYLVISDYLPRVFGDAFLTFGRDHRYWPLFSFGMCIYAAVGATWAWQRMRIPSARALAAAIVLAIGLASPIVAGFGYEEKFPEDPLVAAALRGGSNTILDVLVDEMHGTCRAAVPLKLGRQVFAYTGFKLVVWVALPELDNWGRVRFAELAESRAEGFARLADNQALTLARPEPQRWDELARSYGVDVVVAPARKSGSAAFGGRDETEASGSGEDFFVVVVGDCD
jgi:hypothetical protein